MKIELRKVKIAKFASQETTCFQAEVWVDGKKEGEARNQGHGGPNDIDPHSLGDRIEAYAKTLPDLQSKYGPLKMNADLLIGEILDDYQDRKDLERLLKGKIVFTLKDKPGIWQRKKTKAPGEVEAQGRDPKVAQVLNLLPFDEALALFRKDADAQE